jgi:hypothetical protein
MDKFYMAGTERTGRYLVVLVTGLGRVGYRDLGGGRFRIRIEPASREAGSTLRPSFPGYKEGTGGEEYRFSTVIQGGEDGLRSVIANAVKALVPGGALEVNPAAPDWATELVEATSIIAERKPVDFEVPQEARGVETEADERDRLVSEVRARKLPGANLAGRWSLATLRAKLAAV